MRSILKTLETTIELFLTNNHMERFKRQKPIEEYYKVKKRLEELKGWNV